jgi:hypothetical protein
MILITPRGEVQLDGAVRDPQGASLSRADVPDGGRGDLPHPQRPAA